MYTCIYLFVDMYVFTPFGEWQRCNMVDFVSEGDWGADGKQIIICMYVYHRVYVCMDTYVYVCVYIGIAVHPDGTRVYVADRGNDRVAVFNLDGACLSLIGSGTGKAPGFLQVRVCLWGVYMYTYMHNIRYTYVYIHISMCIRICMCSVLVGIGTCNMPGFMQVYMYIRAFDHVYTYVHVCMYMPAYI